MSLRLAALLFVATAPLMGCKKTAYTERRQLNMVPEGIMNDLSLEAYKDMRREGTVITGTADAERLAKVADRIASVTNRGDYKWKATLFDDDETVNAWCMPGGKIGFHTGILPVLENEAGMAFVMGHEVAHAVLQHGSERMSQQLVALGGLAALGLYIDNRTELETEQTAMILAVLGLGAQVGIMLPFSRMHESEADEVGLMFMARAGYPPSESVQLWNRMEEASGGGLDLQFLSTHPAYDTRRQDLRSLMTKANTRYENNKTKLGGEDPLQTVWR